MDRKKETTTNKTGEDFLYGHLVANDFPIELFVSKWNNRFVNELDDQQAALSTNPGFARDGLADVLIPGVALKIAWQRSQSVSFFNCDYPTILVNFGLRQVGMFNRSLNSVRACPKYQRSFVDGSMKNCRGWRKTNLHTDFYPRIEDLGEEV